MRRSSLLLQAPGSKSDLHFSGPLLDWLERNRRTSSVTSPTSCAAVRSSSSRAATTSDPRRHPRRDRGGQIARSPTGCTRSSASVRWGRAHRAGGGAARARGSWPRPVSRTRCSTTSTSCEPTEEGRARRDVLTRIRACRSGSSRQREASLPHPVRDVSATITELRERHAAGAKLVVYRRRRGEKFRRLPGTY